MMRAKIKVKLLFSTEKNLSLFEKKIKNNILCILVDVGAHHGETIKNFKKNILTTKFIHSKLVVLILKF